MTNRAGTSVLGEMFVHAGWFVVEAFWRASVLEIFDDTAAARLSEELEERRASLRLRRTGTGGSRHEHLT
jgi:hypothetical protein